MTDKRYPEPAELASGTALNASSPGATPGAYPGGSRALTDQDVEDLAHVFTGSISMQIGWLSGAFPPDAVEKVIKAHIGGALKNCQMHDPVTQTHLHVTAAAARKQWEAIAAEQDPFR